MAEILIKATNATNPDPDKDRRGCYKRGMPVEVFEDGAYAREMANPNSLMKLPTFVWLLIPGVPKSKIEKYTLPEMDESGLEEDGMTPKISIYRRRLWKIFVDEMPQAAINKFRDSGVVTIGPTGDYTFAQLRNYFRSLKDDSLIPSDALN